MNAAKRVPDGRRGLESPISWLQRPPGLNFTVPPVEAFVNQSSHEPAVFPPPERSASQDLPLEAAPRSRMGPHGSP